MRIIVLIATLLLFGTKASTQDKCAVNVEGLPHLEETLQFENWLNAKEKAITNLGNEGILQVPVVFHIIHDGEPVGEGKNLSEDRILNQLATLNEDFRRLNPDTTLTPISFLPVAADVGIEFVLAKRDPNGFPSDGIQRVVGLQPTYSSADYRDLMHEVFWDPAEYLNIVVAELSTHIGWATFPYSDLPGITQAEVTIDPLADGVIVHTLFLGENLETGDNFDSYGRTLTHEIGHFLGLKHVWGNLTNCFGNDFCDDTPTQSTSYLRMCPDSTQISCNTEDMYSNFMNYTDDECMNIFTTDQKSRMRTVLLNSPRRVSLLSSRALEFPETFSLDLGISEILTPSISNCNDEIIPSVELINFGSETVVYFELELSLNDTLLLTWSSNSTILPSETLVEQLFFTLPIDNTSYSEIKVSISRVNSLTTTDIGISNNIAAITIPPTEILQLPFYSGFEDEDTLFTISKSSNWTYNDAPSENIANRAAKIDLSDTSFFGVFDILATQVIDMTSLQSAEVSFGYAYGSNGDPWSKDGLIVAVSTDCGESYLPGNYLFERFGQDLVTTSRTGSDFVPSDNSEWRYETINISSYTEKEDLRIAFIGIHGGGNPLYIDSISITPTNLEAFDLGINNVENLPTVLCPRSLFPTIEVTNYGFERISNYRLSYTIEGQTTIIAHDNIGLTSGESTSLRVLLPELPAGNYEIDFEVSEPNNVADDFIDNNIFTQRVFISDNTEGLPQRENFEKTSTWILADNTSEGNFFEIVSIDNNHVLKFNAYETSEIGNEHWFSSPLLDINELEYLSMSFKYAYRSRENTSDNLKIIVHRFCQDDNGVTIFDESSDELASGISNFEFLPTDSDWQEGFLDLTGFTGNEEIRVSFVFRNGNGNNLFLDDIEFYNTPDLSAPRFTERLKVYPNPATDGKFTAVLNLPIQEDVELRMMDLSGKIVLRKRFPYGLNQVMNIETENLQGIYYVRVDGENTSSSAKIIIR